MVGPTNAVLYWGSVGALFVALFDSDGEQPVPVLLVFGLL